MTLEIFTNNYGVQVGRLMPDTYLIRVETKNLSLWSNKQLYRAKEPTACLDQSHQTKKFQSISQLTLEIFTQNYGVQVGRLMSDTYLIRVETKNLTLWSNKQLYRAMEPSACGDGSHETE